jgi:hypothetical protein
MLTSSNVFQSRDFVIQFPHSPNYYLAHFEFLACQQIIVAFSWEWKYPAKESFQHTCITSHRQVCVYAING